MESVPESSSPAARSASQPIIEEADRTFVDRVQGIVPSVRRVSGAVQAVGVVSAVAAIGAWAMLFGEAAWPLSPAAAGAYLALGLLLVPALGTFVAVLTLREVLALSQRIRSLPGAVRDRAREVTGRPAGVAAPEDATRTRRLWGFLGVLWRVRGLVGDTRGSWLRTLALARFARLASLPFALALAGAFLLNFVVIAFAIIVGLLALLL